MNVAPKLLAPRTATRRRALAARAAMVCALLLPVGARAQPAALVDLVATSSRSALDIADTDINRILAALRAIAAQGPYWTDCLERIQRGEACPIPEGMAWQLEHQRQVAEMERLAAERREREAMRRALWDAARTGTTARIIATLLQGGRATLGDADGLGPYKGAVNASVAVDTRMQTLRFTTGRVRHCFSLRNACDASVYRGTP